MAYSAQTVARARQILENRKADRESQYRQNLLQAYREQPRLKEIDKLLRRSMTVAAQAVFTEGGDARQTMEQVKKANLSLQEERAAIIRKSFAPGFLDESPLCPHCGGSGYVGSSMCACLRELCRQEQKKELAKLTTGTEKFQNFRLDYYPERVDPTFGVSPRKIMERTLETCRQYAMHFEPDLGNLLFVGGTGLGKTFLSACIADAVVDKGYSVAYESAPRLFAKLEKDRFDPSEESRGEVARLQNCDLLIIDDLGTELPGGFVTAALYSLISQRLTENKAMIISTNLINEEIAKRYSPQIASRLQGNFRGLFFIGEDIRVLKSK